jgi:hypothetical protein
MFLVDGAHKITFNSNHRLIHLHSEIIEGNFLPLLNHFLCFPQISNGALPASFGDLLVALLIVVSKFASFKLIVVQNWSNVEMNPSEEENTEEKHVGHHFECICFGRSLGLIRQDEKVVHSVMVVKCGKANSKLLVDNGRREDGHVGYLHAQGGQHDCLVTLNRNRVAMYGHLQAEEHQNKVVNQNGAVVVGLVVVFELF